MFYSARVKLAAWYVCIVLLVSILFSLTIYSGINADLKRFEYAQRIREEREENEFFIRPAGIPSPSEELQMISDARGRLILIFVVINGGLAVFAALLGYFLSGRTLMPIKNMVDEQNRFIADASHELRTPITALKTSLEVNLRSKKFDQKKIKTLLESNLEEVNTLQLLSDDLLKLAQYEIPNPSIAFSKVSLLEIVNRAKKIVEPLAHKKEITFDISNDEIFVEGDKKSLSELFVILFDNAIKYSLPEKSIVVSWTQKDHEVEIQVIDQGIGIEKEDLPHIFNRFYRAEKSRSKEVAAGYGLGLSIAKKIVEAHRGYIKASSVKEEGTTFSIILPIKK